MRLVEEVRNRLAAGEDFDKVRAELTEENLAAYENYPNGLYLCADDYESYGSDMILAIQSLEEDRYTSFDNGYATVFVKRYRLPEFGKLTDAEIEFMQYIEDYVIYDKTEALFGGYEITLNEDVI